MASKSKRRRKVLGASCILAALIIAGSSFAWFTSKDEVTNRLSATADYGVTIAEDFTPPFDWIPGQTVEKNVSATNTGNVSAFVRMWVEGEMNLIKEDTTGVALTSAPTIKNLEDTPYIGATSPYTNGEDKASDALKKAHLTAKSGDYYLRVLNTVPAANTYNSTSADATLSEVQALQAGGFLAYAPDNAEYIFGPNDMGGTPSVNYKDYVLAGDSIPNTAVKLFNGVTAGVTQTTDVSLSASNTTLVNKKTLGSIDADTFKPKTTGLYLFRRAIDVDQTAAAQAVNQGATTEAYEYSGYYYVADENNGYGTGTYYALQTKTTGDLTNDEINGGVQADTYASTVYAKGVTTGAAISDGVNKGIPALTVTDVKLFTATQNVITSNQLYWKYTADNKLQAASENGDGVIIDIALANVATTGAEKWTPIMNTGATNWAQDTNGYIGKFYYNNDVDPGKTTSKLIDSVTLNSDVHQNDYIAFDFDLNVNMDSVQVVRDANGKELDTPVNATEGKAWEETADTNGATGAATNAGGDANDPNGLEITSVTWTAKS